MVIVKNDELEIRVQNVDLDLIDPLLSFYEKDFLSTYYIDCIEKSTGETTIYLKTKNLYNYAESRVKKNIKHRYSIPMSWSYNCKVNLSEEQTFIEDNPPKYESLDKDQYIIRHKFRLSYKLPSTDWRLDLTYVTDSAPSDKTITSNINTSKIISMIKDGGGKIELELEYSPDPIIATKYTDEDSDDEFLASIKMSSDENTLRTRRDNRTLLSEYEMFEEIAKSNLRKVTDVLHKINIVPNRKFGVSSHLHRMFGINSFNLQGLLNNAITLNLFNYKDINSDNTYVLTKLDGIRGLLSIIETLSSSGEVVSVQLDLVNKSPNHEFSSNDNINPRNTTRKVLDGEWLEKERVFVVFDFADFSYKSYPARIKAAEMYVAKIVDKVDFDIIVKKPTKLTPDYGKELSHILHTAGYVKEFNPDNKDVLVDITDPEYYECFLKNPKRKISSLTDGIIFVNEKSVSTYHETKHYKWKPVEKNTADLIYSSELDKLCVTNGKCPYVFLMNPGPTRRAKVISELSVPLVNDKVYEARWEDGNWVVMRERRDKTNSNATATVDSVLLHATYPLTAEILLGTEPFPVDAVDTYFKHDSSKLAVKMREVNNLVKTEKIKELFTNSDELLDIGSGRGQDLHKWSNANIKKVLVLEKDKFALYELMSRYYKMRKPKPDVFVLEADFNTDIDFLSEKINNDYADEIGPTFENISIQFAVHYLDQDVLIKFLTRHWTAKNGTIFITVFNKHRVLELLKDTKKWESDDKTVSIERLNTPNMIGVKLPFSGNDVYPEQLFDLDEFMKKLKKVIPSAQVVEQTGFKDIQTDAPFVSSLYDAIVIKN